MVPHSTLYDTISFVLIQNVTIDDTYSNAIVRRIAYGTAKP
ncbi:hypothetical protein ACQKOD_06110 [Bacillus mycoides]